MNRPFLFLTAIVLVAITLSACGPSTIVANPAPPQRTLSVTGTGMVIMTPDIAYINIGVHTEKTTASDAVAENTTQTQQVVAAVKAGANSVNSIQFDVFDKSKALKQARDLAMKDAQTQAQELAATAGITLGPVQTISFYNSVPTPTTQTFGKGGGAVAEAAAPVPIQTGQMTLTVTVNAAYEIK